MQPELCPFGVELCLTRAEWISLYGSLLGAASAFLLATTYQYFRRERERRSARRNLGKVLAELRKAFRVDRGKFDTKLASLAVVDARGALTWAIGHPEIFKFQEWTDLHELVAIIEIWFEDNACLGGFRNSIYMGQGDDATLWALGRRLEYFLDLEIK